MNFTNVRVEPFDVIGIDVGTTNENGQSSVDIPALWDRFISEGISEKVTGKTDNTIYCVYTDYEKDHTRPYTALLGCRVVKPSIVPDGMVYKTIQGGSYHKHVVAGNIFQGIVFEAWKKIWAGNEPRAFTADFEVYGEKAVNPEKAEIDILIAVK